MVCLREEGTDEYRNTHVLLISVLVWCCKL